MFPDAGPDTEDELYESSVTRCNMVYRLEGNALLPYEEYWGVTPKHAMLKRNEVCQTYSYHVCLTFKTYMKALAVTWFLYLSPKDCISMIWPWDMNVLCKQHALALSVHIDIWFMSLAFPFLHSCLIWDEERTNWITFIQNPVFALRLSILMSIYRQLRLPHQWLRYAECHYCQGWRAGHLIDWIKC